MDKTNPSIWQIGSVGNIFISMIEKMIWSILQMHIAGATQMRICKTIKFGICQKKS